MFLICSTARREPHAEQDMEPYVRRAGKCFEQELPERARTPNAECSTYEAAGKPAGRCIASRRSFTTAAFVQDDKKGSPPVILSVSEGSTRSDGSSSPDLPVAGHQKDFFGVILSERGASRSDRLEDLARSSARHTGTADGSTDVPDVTPPLPSGPRRWTIPGAEQCMPRTLSSRRRRRPAKAPLRSCDFPARARSRSPRCYGIHSSTAALRPRHLGLGEIRDPQTGAIVDRAMCVTMPGPASLTGEDVAELHCHGGPYIVRRVLAWRWLPGPGWPSRASSAGAPS